MRRIGIVAGVVLLVSAFGFVILAGARSARRSIAELHPARTVAARPPAVGAFASTEDITFHSPTGLVKGWYVPTRIGTTVVLGHGVGSNRGQLLPEGHTLADAGDGVLLFDWRGMARVPAIS